MASDHDEGRKRWTAKRRAALRRPLGPFAACWESPARRWLRHQPDAPATPRVTADADVVARINELIEQHPTYGYRRIWARVRFGDKRLDRFGVLAVCRQLFADDGD